MTQIQLPAQWGRWSAGHLVRLRVFWFFP
jgi:hypothetical protein